MDIEDEIIAGLEQKEREIEDLLDSISEKDKAINENDKAINRKDEQQ